MRDAVSAASTIVGDVSLRVVRLAMGEPVDIILGAAESGVDLIVAGTHGKSDLTRWFLGSTSAALLADTRGPTLLVPPGQADIVALDGDRARLTPLGLAPAARVLVRQGSVPREIDRAAIEVQGGLVVMGLRERGARGQLATAVLTGNHAAVLGVPLAARA